VNSTVYLCLFDNYLNRERNKKLKYTHYKLLNDFAMPEVSVSGLLVNDRVVLGKGW